MDRCHDFVLHSNESCFLCLGKLEGDVFSQSVVSLQCLFKYLGMDMRKVSNENMSTFSTESSPNPLKAWLCADCDILNEKITKLYQVLEKIEMELKYNLNFIHEKLNSSAESNINSEPEPEQYNILRSEALRKCSLKLGNISPRVTVQKCEMSIVKLKEEKLEYSQTEDLAEVEVEVEEMIHVKEEYSPHQEDLDDPIADQSDKDFDPSDEDEDMSYPEVSSEEDMEIKIEVGVTAPPGKTTSKLSKPIKRPDKPYTIDESTGQYLCKLCPEVFPNYHKHFRHWEKVHVKAKFSCKSCDAQFNFRESLGRHYRTHHMGVRFRCISCDKTFTLKHNLYEHQRVAGCGRGAVEGGHQPLINEPPERHPCTYKDCGKEFSRARDLRRHLNSFHLQIKAHECNLCGKKFQRKYQVGQHIRAIHKC